MKFLTATLALLLLALLAVAGEPLPQTTLTLPQSTLGDAEPLILIAAPVVIQEQLPPSPQPVEGRRSDEARIAELERRVAELEKKCGQQAGSPATMPVPAGYQATSVTACQTTTGYTATGYGDAGACAGGQCGSAARFQPFGGRFRRR